MMRRRELEETPAWRAALAVAVPVVSLALLAAGAMAGWQRLEQFFVESPRFQFRAARTPRQPLPDLRVSGVSASRIDRVQSVFAPDGGRSVYLVPLAERRDQLRAMSWVRDASVSRIWPQTVEVRVAERVPVAIAQLPAAGRPGRSQTMLVDADGVLLELPAKYSTSLPVLIGLRADQDASTRRERIERLLAILRELGSEAGKLSEFDLSDPDNARVTLEAGGRPYVLILGSDQFLSRLLTFFKYYSEIVRLPDARVLDLRLEGRIAVVKEERP
jgi:cell division protein FtsQ